MSADSRSVVLVTFPDVQLLDVSGPLQVFASANELAVQRGLAEPYASRVVAAEAGLVTTSSGLTVLTKSIDSVKGCIDTLIVAGGRGVATASADVRLTVGYDGTVNQDVSPRCVQGPSC